MPRQVGYANGMGGQSISGATERHGQFQDASKRAAVGLVGCRRRGREHDKSRQKGVGLGSWAWHLSREIWMWSLVLYESLLASVFELCWANAQPRAGKSIGTGCRGVRRGGEEVRACGRGLGSGRLGLWIPHTHSTGSVVWSQQQKESKHAANTNVDERGRLGKNAEGQRVDAPRTASTARINHVARRRGQMGVQRRKCIDGREGGFAAGAKGRSSMPDICSRKRGTRAHR